MWEVTQSGLIKGLNQFTLNTLFTKCSLSAGFGSSRACSGLRETQNTVFHSDLEGKFTNWDEPDALLPGRPKLNLLQPFSGRPRSDTGGCQSLDTGVGR